MRKALTQALTKLAAQDRRIVLLTGDLGFMALEPFINEYPDRFFNAGVAEQNMVGMATGLAEAGFVPFVYSICTFAALRPYEFIRNGPIQHRLPVRIVGVGGGVEYGQNGLSHYGLEDVGVMRLQPGIRVIAPADHEQMRSALMETWDLPGPIYYRIGKDDKSVVEGLQGRFRSGHVETVGNGKDLLLISTGSISIEVVKAAALLQNKGVACTVLVVAPLNPAPIEDLKAVLSEFKTVLTVEAHYITGGLGSLICEVIVENELRCRLRRCGIGGLPEGLTGSQQYMYEKYGLTADQLALASLNFLQESEER